MTKSIKVKVINESTTNALPAYETEGSAGMDLRAHINGDSPFSKIVKIENKEEHVIDIAPGELRLISTGLKVEIPAGYELQVRPRSGLAYKNMVTVLNSPGTIDSDYRGVVGVLLFNHHPSTVFRVRNGERIAQAVFAEYVRAEYDNVTDLSATDRGEGGFGSTGK
ncbi:deoxyuridine 5'-triphosphate nucleotidohydrolase protein [Rhizobium phage RHph_TM40]|nr:deoxyuridine 5'-triphosphate nucleotidohydrolase protein [Rhizobium phage RHph_TM40]QIG72403.1 deoxyuridine 5'-triphosphate nucleotidohydrolase protein [Rhizobium phage RHph_TM3_3_6]QIG77793.1 deoxyuridine 5'-triphosphate nucleotidohydrolase protein [Rhizobium phage RHph_TM61]